MRRVIVDLPRVKASGRREGWWLHVTSADTQCSKPGFAAFEGNRLAHGNCELPPHAVLLSVRPFGLAKADERRADVYRVGGDGILYGVEFGFEWVEGSSYNQLKEVVTRALGVQHMLTQLGEQLTNTSRELVGHAISPALRELLCVRLSGVLSRYLPPDSDVDMTSVQGDPHSVLITLRLPTYEEVSRG